MPRRNRPRARNRLRSRQRRGAAAVEFAICANIFFLLMFTCMEFARMNMIRNLAQDAAYFAARHAIVPGATEAEATAIANEVMGMVTNTGYTVQVEQLGIHAENAVVTVSVDFDQIALFAPLFLPNATIATTAEMRTERYEGFYRQDST